jgi:exodeoxyribonuclease VIII
MQNADYHRHYAVSKSGLDQIAKSPLHYWARYLDPNRVWPEPTPAMRLGTALHTHVLELDQWDNQIAVAPGDINRRTKEGKEQWAAFEAAAKRKTVITADEAETVMAMGRSIMRHPGAAMLLGLQGKAETTHMWTDATYGVECKCRPDWLTDDGSIMVDLKTTRDASPRGFRQSIASFRYWVQAGWYMHGVQAATGKRPDQFIFICVESTAPYACAVYAADAEMIERGYEQAMKDLGTLATCRAADSWPSYSDQIETISLPGWMQPRPDGSMPTITEIETY